MGNTKKAQFLIGRRGTDEKFAKRWQNIDLSKHIITKPTVLVLGGNFTNSNRMANGYAKLVASMLGDFAGDVDILSANYNDCNNYFSPVLEESIIKLARELFIPLISANGQRLSLEEACKNVRKLTIFAHCFGYNNVVLGMQEVLFNLFAEFDYDVYESGEIMEQLFVVSFGTEIKKDWFKSVNIVSPFDPSYYDTSTQIWRELIDSDFEGCKFITESDKNELKRISELPIGKQGDAIKKFCEKNPRCFVVRRGNRLSLATSQIKDDVLNEHGIREFARDDNWKSSGKLTASGEQTSKCLAVSLCTAVANSLENERKKEFVPIDMDEFETTLNGLVYAFNVQKTEPYGKEM